jgi:amino acid transporter
VADHSSSPASAVVAPGAAEKRPEENLQGNLGTMALVFTALAFNAPLAVLAATVPIVIGLGIGGATPLIYLAVMALFLVFAVSLVTMARHMKKPGAFYTYVTAGLGRSLGLGGGFLALVLYLGLGSSTYIIVGFTNQILIRDVLGGPDIAWWVIALVMWAAISTLTLLNIDVSVRFVGIALAFELVVVAVWSVVVVANGGPEGRGVDLTGGITFGPLAFALLWGASCMGGFESIQVFRSETRDPDRTIPRATYITVALLATFYCLGAYVYLVAFGTDAAMATAADPTNSFMASLGEYVGTYMKVLGYVLAFSSAAAALLAIQNIASRYVFALSRDGVLPERLSAVHPRFRSPLSAAVVVASVVLVLALGPAVLGMEPLLAYTVQYGLANFALVTLFAGTALATLVFFSRSANRSLRIPAWKRAVAPALALLGMLTILLLTINNRDTLFGSTERGTYGIGFVILVAALGALYAQWLKVRKPDVYERIGDQDEHGELVPLATPLVPAQDGANGTAAQPDVSARS